MLETAHSRAGHIAQWLSVAGAGGRGCGSLLNRRRKWSITEYSYSQRSRGGTSESYSRGDAYRSSRDRGATGARICKRHCSGAIPVFVVVSIGQAGSNSKLAMQVE